jgi:redox-sensitive bicupin YhaK (pirin superfamily)
MIRVIPAQDRHFTDFGWLKTYWLFSFANYYDPDNIQFGALRVFNDDVVQPGTGFPTHPHHEMEIVTVVLDGEITHEDSMGNKNVIRAGDVQRMSAGTGLTHSEFDLAEEPVHFYQIWIYPDERELRPTYDQRTFEPSSWRNRLFPVASGQNLPNVVTFHTDATIYRAELDPGQTIEHLVGDTRRVFVYLTGGMIDVNDQTLNSKDQARADLESRLFFRAHEPSSLVLIDVPSCKGWGYDEKTLRGGKA